MRSVYITGPELVDDARVRLIAAYAAAQGYLPVWLDVGAFADKLLLAPAAVRYAGLVANAGGEFWSYDCTDRDPSLGAFRSLFMVSMLRCANDRDIRLWTWDRWEKCLEGSL